MGYVPHVELDVLRVWDKGSFVRESHSGGAGGWVGEGSMSFRSSFP